MSKVNNIDFQRVYDSLINSTNEELKDFGILMSRSSTFAHKAHKEFKMIREDKKLEF